MYSEESQGGGVEVVRVRPKVRFFRRVELAALAGIIGRPPVAHYRKLISISTAAFFSSKSIWPENVYDFWEALKLVSLQNINVLSI